MKKLVSYLVLAGMLVCTSPVLAKATLETDFFVSYQNHASLFTYDNDMNMITGSLEPDWGNLVVAEKSGRFGCIDKFGRTIIPVQFKQIKHLGNDFYAAKDKGEWSVYNQQGQLIGSGYAEVGAFSEGMIAVKQDGRWGYITEQGVLAIPYTYRAAAIFTDGLAAVKQDGKYSYINKAGQTAIAAVSSKPAGLFGSGLAPVRKSGHWVYIDKSGAERFEADYELTGAFQNGLAPIYVEKTKLKVGNILKAALKFRISFNSDISDITGVDWREDTLKRGYIDVYGRKVIPTNYDFVGTIQDGMVHIIEGDEHGYANMQGQITVPFKYDEGRDFSDGYAAAKLKKWGYVDKNGQPLTEFVYDEVGDFSNGMGAVKQDGRWSYVDSRGQLIAAPQFKAAQPFHNDAAAVKTSDGWGVINKDGAFIVQPSSRYKEIVNTKDGIIMIKNGSKWQAINLSGSIIAEGYKMMK